MAKRTKSAPENAKQFLLVLLVLVIVGGSAAFYFALDYVRSFATEVNHSIVDSEASGKQIQELQALRSEITESESLIAKANQIFASSETYQTQSVTDIRRYAERAGLTVEKTSFGEDTSGETRTVTVTLEAPVSYAKLIQFFDGLEGNVPKIQVSSVTLENVPGGGADAVKVGDIVLKVAVQ